MKTALLAGATGLIGQQLLLLLLESDRYNQVKVITRKPITLQHPFVYNIIFNFDNLLQHADELKANDIFCCLGTTMKKAGSKESFRHVDYDYPVELAKITKEAGADHYSLVSAAGADKESSIFYNRVKGETEEAIRAISFRSFHIYRPSLLLGARNESRTGEDAAKAFFKIFGFLVPLKYKAIDSIKVARAMLHGASQEQEGVHIHESAYLQKF